MYPGPTDDELAQLLDECETALSTVRRTIAACPRDLVAKVALPPLERSLRQLARDVQGWIEGAAAADDDEDNHGVPSTEHFDRLCQFVRQSKQTIIGPQAQKIGLRVVVVQSAGRISGLSFYNILYIFALFVAQGLAVAALDRLQTSPSWIGNVWAPHLASLLATYVLVFQHQTSWIPTLCYLVAQGLCLWVAALSGLWGILGLLLILVNIVPALHR
ncbi:hypothetical protein F5Y12DRAFT_301405 [Xylaria sp. FL1777]|nr:hypothetical protein F5Y12DRAFT_301405 [Xylaria sp. FL1777]